MPDVPKNLEPEWPPADMSWLEVVLASTRIEAKAVSDALVTLHADMEKHPNSPYNTDLLNRLVTVRTELTTIKEQLGHYIYYYTVVTEE